MEPGLPSLHPLYSIPAALEYPTYHFCKTRPLDFQDEIKLPTPPLWFCEEKQTTKANLCLNHSYSGPGTTGTKPGG